MDVTLHAAMRGKSPPRTVDSEVLDYTMFKMCHVAAESLMADRSPYGPSVFDARGHDAVHEWTFPLAAGKQFAMETLPRMGDEDDNGWTNQGNSKECLPSFLPRESGFRLKVQTAAVPGFMKRRSLKPTIKMAADIRPLGSTCIHRDAFVVPLTENGGQKVVSMKRFPGFSDYCLVVRCMDKSRWALFPTTNPWRNIKTRPWASLGKFLRSRMSGEAALRPTCVVVPRFQRTRVCHSSARIEGATLEVDRERAVMISDSTIELDSALDAEHDVQQRSALSDRALVFADKNTGIVCVSLDRPVHVFFRAMRGRSMENVGPRRAALW